MHNNSLRNKGSLPGKEKDDIMILLCNTAKIRPFAGVINLIKSNDVKKF